MYPGGNRVGAEEEAAVVEVLRSKRLFRYYGAVEGPSAVEAFEVDVADMLGTSHAIAVASGKGGVGKSTTAVNLALALHKAGARVGVMDGDVYGPSLPLLTGTSGRPSTEGKKIVPLEGKGLNLMSIGYFTDDDSPVIWRGPMVHGLIRQFLTDVLLQRTRERAQTDCEIDVRTLDIEALKLLRSDEPPSCFRIGKRVDRRSKIRLIQSLIAHLILF